MWVRRVATISICLVFFLPLASCDPASDDPSSPATDSVTPVQKPATSHTEELNAALAKTLPFGDRKDFEDAQRGFVATLPNPTIVAEDGHTVWSLSGYDFLQQDEAPASVNPSLWRMAQLNLTNGLFQVTDRIYQVRGFDVSNMTIIEGDTGVILIDPLTNTETARAGLDLYYHERGEKPVVAVVYTHSHVDHYGGVKGVVNEADVESGQIAVLAPAGFLEAAVSENVNAGTAMSRRASYQYGLTLPPGPLGQVDNGIGKAHPKGSITLIPPTDLISGTGQTRTIDGIEMVFQDASGTEAPAEMTIYFPQLKALNVAEIACPLLHNVLTLRGAQVRDPKLWSEAIDELIALYGDDVELLLAQHNWPRWGRDESVAVLVNQRDLYRFINDQTLRLINHGYTPLEIADQLQLPESLSEHWYTHGYYGTLSHNVRAVYQRYMGWYDGVPANLNPLPPVEAAAKYVEYMGGADAVMELARADFSAGNYRWVAQVMHQVVFADPDNTAARNLEADALEQLAYQSESGPWRNIYLVGAQELRQGPPEGISGESTANADTIRAMSIPLFFDYWGVRLNAEKAAGKNLVINWRFTDTGEEYALTVSNAAMTYRANWQSPDAGLGLTLERTTLNAIILGETDFGTAVKSGAIGVVGNGAQLQELLSMLDTFDPIFPIVTP